MNALLWLIDAVLSVDQRVRRRLRCLHRRAHNWLPVLDGTLCRDCGLRRD